MTWSLRRLWHPWKPEDVEPGEAKTAVQQARADLCATEARTEDVEALARSLHHAARRNHFSEAMEALAVEMSKKRHT